MGLQFVPSKWVGFVFAIWVQVVSGNNYTFSNYSNALKSLMFLSQLQLNNLSVAKDVGKAFGLLPGLASDRLPTSLILLIGGVEGLIGYGVQWLVVSQRIQPLPYWQMCVFLCMGGNSTTWMNTAVLVTCMRNFKNNQGPVSGILKGYVGLSTAIFTDLCAALFSSSPSAFLLTLAIAPAVVCLIAAFFLRETPPTAAEDPRQSQIFHFFNALAFVVAVYLSVFDLSGSHGKLVSLVFAIGLLVLLVSPLVVPVYLMVAKSGSISDPEGLTKEPLLVNVKVAEDDVSDEVRLRPMIGEDHTIREALLRFDFWVLFVSFLCGVGTGLCVSNNLGQMGAALGYGDVSIFISLTSIWGFFGRIISGMASEHFIGKVAMPRPIWNAVSGLLMIIGYVVMAVGFSGSLHIGSMLVGMCYGARIAVTVPVTSDLFGLKCYGLLYNILILNLPLGSFLFSGLLAGYLYDAEAVSSGDGGNDCTGPHCYRLVFVIMAAACGFGVVLDMVLVVRTRKVYRKMFERKKFQALAAPPSTSYVN
ncbi:PREDICTED: protein NUCLEAR FUSION DEFECTIVE 4-like [Ipomoea nil]|uniref:protein NUCLEAR FUSION DEFECTIVE 4-like n=1 Tax=Ipomoea nil TaxID=35883 RepID=UPI000901DBB3|nr:PREDICTED: protein NUCLEAR FUSION DEFECTIVE 4-like [Ipomoea nil]